MVPPRRRGEAPEKPKAPGNAKVMPQAIKKGPRPLKIKGRGLFVNYSHSMVPTGLGVRSYKTRQTPGTSARMRAVIFFSTS